MRKVTKVFAPAVIGNLSVGFDVLGVAIDGPGDEIIIRNSDQKGLVISKITKGKGIPMDPKLNTAGKAALALLKELDAVDIPLNMEIYKKMPICSGLGSSAASAVAAVYAINNHLGKPYEKRQLLKFALQGEKLTTEGSECLDNIAPSLLGGMILSKADGSMECTRLPYIRAMRFVVIYQHISIKTSESRFNLPSKIDLSSHTKQAANLAFLVSGMYRGDIEMIRRAMKDNIVEPIRKASIPNFDVLKEIAESNSCISFGISGSGPSLFAMFDNSFNADEFALIAKAALKKANMRNTVYNCPIHQEGAFML